MLVKKISEFHCKLDDLCSFSYKKNVLAVAVSGGKDSLSLLVSLYEFYKGNDVKIHVLTVNHKLRTEACDEVLWVKNFCDKLGVYCEILSCDWGEDGAPQTSIMERARNSRYNLLLSYCVDNEIDRLYVAHNENDNIETFYLRKNSSSSFWGMAGIADVKNVMGVNILRPFLDVTRDDITNFLKVRDFGWVNDPSNVNLKFGRVKIRHNLSFEQINFARRWLSRFSRIRFYITSIVDIFLKRHFFIKNSYFYFNYEVFKGYSHNIQVIILQFIILNIVNLKYPCGKVQLNRLLDYLNYNKKSFTLAGLEFIRDDGLVFVLLEKRIKESMIFFSDERISYAFLDMELTKNKCEKNISKDDIITLIDNIDNLSNIVAKKIILGLESVINILLAKGLGNIKEFTVLNSIKKIEVDSSYYLAKYFK